MDHVKNVESVNRKTIKSTNGLVEIDIDGEGDDRGVHLRGGQFSVGEWNDPRESVFGEGDSTTDTMIVLQTDDDVTYTDVTAIFASDIGSTQGMFNGTTPGKTIYVGGDFEFTGVKVKIDTDGVVEPENVVLEYWDGATWQGVNYMATAANFPFSQYGWDLAQHNSGSEQWRFDFDPFDELPEWQQSDINGVTKYWGRFRIVAAITTDPIIEQIKLHTNRFQIKENGFTEYMGTSRYKKNMLSGVTRLINNGAESPRNESIEYAPGVTASLQDNRLESNNDQSTLFVLNIPEGLDTSIKVIVDISFKVVSATTGNIDLELNKILVEDGFIYDGNGTMILCDAVLKNIPVAIADQRATARFFVELNDALPDSAYLMQIKRNGSSGADTLGSNIGISHLEVDGYFWKP